MFRRIFHIRTYHWAGVIPLYEYRDPYDDTEPKLRKQPETGLERVKALFQYGENGYVSEEYIGTIQLGGCGFLGGLFIGFGFEAFNSFNKFIDVNQHTRFVSAYEARRKLQDYIFLEGIKSGLKYGVRIGAFTLLLGLTSTVISAYRDKQGILEYTLGTAIAGALVRLPVGFVASGVGFCVGASLGTLLGSVLWGLGKLSGTTIKDTHKMLFDVKVQIDKSHRDLMKRAQESAYESNDLKQWLQNKMETPKHKLDDEDMRYVLLSPKENDVEQVSNEDGIKHENMSKENAGKTLATMKIEESPKEKASESSN